MKQESYVHCIGTDNGHPQFAESEADARAKMLIYLLENSLLKT